MRPPVHPNTFVGLVALMAGLAIYLFAGCSTVTQAPVRSETASWDGNAQNSGILAKTAQGYVVTGDFRARYNSLIASYGKAKTTDGSPIFNPPLKADNGVTPASQAVAQAYGLPLAWIINDEGMADMVVLSDLKRRGFAP